MENIKVWVQVNVGTDRGASMAPVIDVCTCGCGYVAMGIDGGVVYVWIYGYGYIGTCTYECGHVGVHVC